MPSEDLRLPWSEFDSLAPEQQKVAMRLWFQDHYEDPAERTPYESAEGGYQWIWGGPYYAREVLEDEFGSSCDAGVLDELVGELDSEGPEWGPVEQPEDYEDYSIESILSIRDCAREFRSSIGKIKILLDVVVPGEAAATYVSILYVSVITALETYLSDRFVQAVLEDRGALERFVEYAPEFRQKKIAYSKILKEAAAIEQRVREHLAEMSWHNLPRVKPMYQATFGIELPGLNDLTPAILRRHDIVHRGGRSKGGDEISTSPGEVEELIKHTERAVSHVEKELEPDF